MENSVKTCRLDYHVTAEFSGTAQAGQNGPCSEDPRHAPWSAGESSPWCHTPRERLGPAQPELAEAEVLPTRDVELVRELAHRVGLAAVQPTLTNASREPSPRFFAVSTSLL